MIPEMADIHEMKNKKLSLNRLEISWQIHGVDSSVL